MAISSIIHQTQPHAPLAPSGPNVPPGATLGAEAAFRAEMESLIGTRGEHTALQYFEQLELLAARNRATPTAASETPSDMSVDPATTDSDSGDPATETTPPTDKDEEFSFWDALDVINPLQHIPLVNLLYREITGDEIKPVAKIAGGALFGGGIGLISAIGDSMLEEVSGKSLGGHAMAMLKSDDAPPSSTMLANRDKLYKLAPDGPLTTPSAVASDFNESI